MLERLLKSLTPAAFVQAHYARLPHSEPGGCAELVPLGTWQRVGRILDAGGDALVARGGQLREGGRPSSADAKELHGRGWTIVLRHAERHDEALAELARGFEEDLAAPVNVHVYCTPASRHGFGWHYDAEEVFALQLAGRKEYRLRKNTINPLPLEETLPRDMGFENERNPIGMACALAPGDWLYVPSGWWHRADAAEDSISLAVGATAPAGIDALDALRRRLLSSMLWRRRLPVAGKASGADASAIEAETAAHLRELARDFAEEMARPEFARELLRRPKNTT